MTRLATLLVLCAALAGCGPSPITESRLEPAIAGTFANLVHLQLLRIGLPSIAASDLKVVASCYRIGGGSIGAGEWTCSLIWAGPNGATVRDSYDVAVTTDGCYTATVGGSESQLGGPAMDTPGRRQVRNVLYSFEGCFSLDSN
jgi:hypothetical protein